ncbi:MAG: hypothetical protein K2X66_04495 [Cyanobacteria bacterium]|jgi:hypothetical protein|nr:hypothetical protein [Cyanobacteriota bacterium]
MKFNKSIGAGLAFALLLGLTFPLASQADTPPETSINVGEQAKADFNPYTVEIPRLYTVDSTVQDSVLLTLVNKSANHTVFKAPEWQVQGNSYLIPAGTTRSLAYSKSGVGYETRNVEYTVEKLPDPVPPGPQFEDWKNRLAALIAAQRPDYSYFPQYQFNK